MPSEKIRVSEEIKVSNCMIRHAGIGAHTISPPLSECSFKLQFLFLYDLALLCVNYVAFSLLLLLAIRTSIQFPLLSDWLNTTTDFKLDIVPYHFFCSVVITLLLSWSRGTRRKRKSYLLTSLLMFSLLIPWMSNRRCIIMSACIIICAFTSIN